MAKYTNSPLVQYTKLSPNNSGTRTMAIDRISPHCVVGQCTIETLGSIFYPTSRQASSNYGIDKDGRVGMFVPESKRSWCTSSNANDQRAITIECASDSFAPYAFKDVVYKRLIELCADICKRNGKTKLIWIPDKAKALAYSPKSGEMLITVHRWFANKSCPGDWLYNRLDDLANQVNALIDPTPVPKKGYLVQVTTLLNVRKGPGVEYDAWYIKGQTPIPSGGIYTIVDEATAKDGGKWGLLKAFSEQRNGWINLGYTKKV